MPSTTTRLSLPYPLSGDQVLAYPPVSATQMLTLDNSVIVTQGTFAAMPVANTKEINHLYRATDENQWYINDGAAWHRVALTVSPVFSGTPQAPTPSVGDNSTKIATTAYVIASVPSRGATNIATAESTSSAAYTTLATPDQVAGIILPTNGLITVWYQATYTSSGPARAAIFLNSNQLTIANQGNGVEGPITTAAGLGPSAVTSNICTWTGGIAASVNPSVSNYTGDATTGQVVGAVNSGALIWEANGSLAFLPDNGVNTTSVAPMGGPCHIFAAAGTYTVSVRYKTSSGSVTASNRKLWVETKSFS